MTPPVSRDILRKQTAYSAGRVVANVLLLLALIGSAIFIAVTLSQLDQGATLNEVTLVACAYMVGSAFASILIWSLAHALFDLADCALERREWRE